MNRRSPDRVEEGRLGDLEFGDSVVAERNGSRTTNTR